MTPSAIGLRCRVSTKYSGSTAVTISEEMSVSRLTEPSTTTVPPTDRIVIRGPALFVAVRSMVDRYTGSPPVAGGTGQHPVQSGHLWSAGCLPESGRGGQPWVMLIASTSAWER